MQIESKLTQMFNDKENLDALTCGLKCRMRIESYATYLVKLSSVAMYKTRHQALLAHSTYLYIFSKLQYYIFN